MWQRITQLQLSSWGSICSDFWSGFSKDVRGKTSVSLPHLRQPRRTIYEGTDIRVRMEARPTDFANL